MVLSLLGILIKGFGGYLMTRYRHWDWTEYQGNRQMTNSDRDYWVVGRWDEAPMCPKAILKEQELGAHMR